MPSSIELLISQAPNELDFTGESKPYAHNRDGESDFTEERPSWGILPSL